MEGIILRLTCVYEVAFRVEIVECEENVHDQGFDQVNRKSSLATAHLVESV